MEIALEHTSFVRRILAPALFVAAVIPMLVGCGPVQSTAGISDAEASMSRAEMHDAHLYSPYEYYQAQHYLYKAKQQWGYSNFETARDYADEARRAANAAHRNAQEAPWRGHPVYGTERPGEIEDFEEQLQEVDDLDEVEDLDEVREEADQE